MRNKVVLALTNIPSSVPVPGDRADKFLSALANVPYWDKSPDGPNAKQDANGGLHIERPANYADAWRRIENLYHELYPKYGNPDHERPNNPTCKEPGLAWQDPDYPDEVIIGDIPPKLRQAWELVSAQSRKMFLICELAYYLRGPAMLAAATEAHHAQMEGCTRAREEGLTEEQAWVAGHERWSEVYRRETSEAQKIWTIADADPFAQVLLRAIVVADRMRRCGNPDCPAPYFIGGRRSQRYCGDACSLPAQREFKRTWWREHGSNSRGKRHPRGLEARRKLGLK
jgi:hypothetical protein